MTAANRAVLQPLVRLIPLLVHDAATIRTKEYAGEQAPLRHSGWGVCAACAAPAPVPVPMCHGL